MASLFPLSESHQFPMLDEDVLAVADMSPGFAINWTTWQFRIASYGLLVQHVLFDEGKPERRFQEFIVELPDGFVDVLRQRVSDIRFETFPERFESHWDDLGQITVFFRLNDGALKRAIYSGAADEEGEVGVQIKNLIELWHLLHLHAPYPKDFEKKQRTKRQSKMDERRRKRIEKKSNKPPPE